MNIQSQLDEMGIRYQLRCHPTAYTAADLAAKEHIPGREVIKPVVIQADGQFVMCALPASHRIDLDELQKQLMAREVKLVDEPTLADLCRHAECEMGAEPPVGPMFGMATLMDESLLQDNQVTFQAGTHEEAVTMSLADYRKLAKAEIAHFGRHL